MLEPQQLQKSEIKDHYPVDVTAMAHFTSIEETIWKFHAIFLDVMVANLSRTFVGNATQT